RTARATNAGQICAPPQHQRVAQLRRIQVCPVVVTPFCNPMPKLAATQANASKRKTPKTGQIGTLGSPAKPCKLGQNGSFKLQNRCSTTELNWLNQFNHNSL